MGSGGIAKVLKDKASSCKGSVSNIEVECKDCLIANYEFAHLNDKGSEYAVFPAQHADKALRKIFALSHIVAQRQSCKQRNRLRIPRRMMCVGTRQE